jgi:hypothetical protein
VMSAWLDCVQLEESRQGLGHALSQRGVSFSLGLSEFRLAACLVWACLFSITESLPVTVVPHCIISDIIF